MRLQLFKGITTYSGVQTEVLFLSEGGNADLAVYLPSRIKMVPNKGSVPTWSPEGVMSTRIKEILKAKGMGTRHYHQAENHSPARHLATLLHLLEVNALTIVVDKNTVTVITQRDSEPTDKVLADVKESIVELFKSFNVDELTRTLRGFDDIQEVNVLTTETDVAEVYTPSEETLELEKTCEVINQILRKEGDVANRHVTMECGCICVRIPEFGTIWTTISEDDEDVQEVHINTKSAAVKDRLDALNNEMVTQAIEGVLRHVSKDCDTPWQAIVRPTCTINYPDGEVMPETKGNARPHRERSIREMTHQADVRFKLPVTPVLYNYTNIQVAVDGARVVSYTNNVRLQEMQYEGDPVIGVILDFNHPIAGMHDMNAVRSKNPNLPIYILWNSEAGPMLELYSES